jgi:hypothetical protein
MIHPLYDVNGVRDDLGRRLADLGVTVVTDHDARYGIRPVGSVVGVWDDSRVSTPDGAVFVSGAAGEGLLGGNVTDLNGATALSIGVEFVVTPATTTSGMLFARRTGTTPTNQQIAFVVVNGNRLRVQIGDGASTVAAVQGAANGVTSGVRYFAFFDYDGAQATDETKCTFWIASFDPLANGGAGQWSAVAQAASAVATAGVPAALLSLANANIAVGRAPEGTATIFNGIIGGNGARVMVFPAPLSQANKDAVITGAATPQSLGATLLYNFSGSTPFTNLGTAGAVGDLTAGANTVLCSGDRRYAQLASAGTSRPSYVTGGVAPVCTFDGVNDYLRNVSVGQLEGITDEEMDVFICVPPVGAGNRMLGQMSVGTTNRLSAAWNTGVANAYETRLSGAAGATIAGPLAGMRCLFFRRSGTGASTTSAIRNGLGTEVTTTLVGDTSAAPNRMTVAASRLDTASQFADMQLVRKLTLRGATTADIIAASQELVSAWAARYAGATV